jgi:hypothetical protein
VPRPDDRIYREVLDGKVAGRAVEVLASVLADYDLRGHVGVAVEGIGCGDAL